MFDIYTNLKPLQAAAQLLAEKDDWGQLYDIDVLAANTVPVVITSYSIHYTKLYDLLYQLAKGCAENPCATILIRTVKVTTANSSS